MNLYSLSYEELFRVLKQDGLDDLRCRQVYDGLYKSRALELKFVTTLPKEIKTSLAEKHVFFSLKGETEERSKATGTVKFLFKFPDCNCVEGVALPNTKKSWTFCISTQAGCGLKCDFCASGKLGLARNLETHEIVEQVMWMKKTLGEVTNIVLMGVGEPFNNYDNVMAAVHLINDPKLAGIGARNITISTSGVIEGIRKMADVEEQIRLSVSLHFPWDDVRSKYMPVNRANPLPRLMEALKEYQDKTGRQITFEYILFRDLNDHLQAADDMRKLLQGLEYKINLIPYNPVKGTSFHPPKEEKAKKFIHHLLKKGVKATLRYKKGDDINAACGQLRLITSMNGPECLEAGPGENSRKKA
jgi:23S rRNA (adenine2503-C2)-methyltransferase